MHGHHLVVLKIAACVLVSPHYNIVIIKDIIFYVDFHVSHYGSLYICIRYVCVCACQGRGIFRLACCRLLVVSGVCSCCFSFVIYIFGCEFSNSSDYIWHFVAQCQFRVVEFHILLKNYHVS